MQASICMFVSINPHKVGEDSLSDAYRAKHLGSSNNKIRVKQKLNNDEKINYCKVSVSSISIAVETVHTAVILQWNLDPNQGTGPLFCQI